MSSVTPPSAEQATSSSSECRKSVCVVGAGLSGLVTTKALLAEGIDVAVYEQYGEAGGTWVLRDPSDGTHTSMYPDLLTNLPPEIMELPGFPFPKDTPLFFTHTIFKEYLQDYARHFDLMKHIRFFCTVESCEFQHDSKKWIVDIKTKDSKTRSEFDFLAVCSGHYFQPNMPQIRGQDAFPGVITHTHNFRHGEDFRDKNVLIVGAGNSALDVVHFIKPFARSLHISSRSLSMPDAYKGLPADKPAVDHLESSGEVIFKDGSFLQHVDVIMCATGYKYYYPFLSKSIPNLLAPNGTCINRLFEHVWWIDNPALAFLDIPWRSLPSIVTSLQSVWIAKVWSGKTALPSKEDMLKSVSARRRTLAEDLSASTNDEERKESNRLDPNSARVDRFMHCLAGEERFRYIDRLADCAGLPRVPDRIAETYRTLARLRIKTRGY